MLLSLFPQMLFLAPAGTTLLRIAAALCFAYIAYDLIKRQSEITSISLPIIGRPRVWIIQISAYIVALIAILLFVGAWTQGIAILAAIAALKHVVFYRKYKGMLTFSLSTYLLLLSICLMLIVTGSGAFAFDLPL